MFLSNCLCLPAHDHREGLLALRQKARWGVGSYVRFSHSPTENPGLWPGDPHLRFSSSVFQFTATKLVKSRKYLGNCALLIGFGTLHIFFHAVKNIMLGSKTLGIMWPLQESVEHRRMRSPSVNLTSRSQWWQMLLSYGEERAVNTYHERMNETTEKWILWISRQRDFLTFLVLCSGPRKLSRSWWLPEPLQPRHLLLHRRLVLCHWMSRGSVQERHSHDLGMERRGNRQASQCCIPYLPIQTLCFITLKPGLKVGLRVPLIKAKSGLPESSGKVYLRILSNSTPLIRFFFLSTLKLDKIKPYTVERLIMLFLYNVIICVCERDMYIFVNIKKY